MYLTPEQIKGRIRNLAKENKYPYAENILYDEVIQSVKELFNKL